MRRPAQPQLHVNCQSDVAGPVMTRALSDRRDRRPNADAALDLARLVWALRKLRVFGNMQGLQDPGNRCRDSCFPVSPK